MFHSMKTDFSPSLAAFLVKSLRFLPTRHTLAAMSLLFPLFPPCSCPVMQDKELPLAVALDFQLQLNFQLCPALSWCAAGPVTLNSC